MADEADGGGGTTAPDEGAGAATGATLKVAAVAARLGVAPATLRTWARRYGLGPSAHTAGAHRQYSLGDLERLMVMRRMTLEGYSPAEAARVALEATPGDPSGAATADPSPLAGVLAAVPPVPVAPVGPPRPPAPRREAPADRTAAPSVRALARAAMALQEGECTRQLEAHAAVDGVALTWTALARPVLDALAQRVGAVPPGRTPAGLLQACLMEKLRGVADDAPVAGPRVLVLRPCAVGFAVPTVDGGGDLLAHVAATVLRESGADSAVLPGRHDAERVAAVAEQEGAAVLVVAADAVVEPAALAETARLVDPRGARVVLVGRGWGQGAAGLATVVRDLGDLAGALA